MVNILYLNNCRVQHVVARHGIFISLSGFQFPRAPTCLCAHMISIIDSVTEQVSKMDVKIGVPQLVPTASKKIKKFRK